MTPRENILGVGISAINMNIAVDTIAAWIAEAAREYVCVTGVHGIMERRRSESVRHIHNSAGLVTPDGMPLVWFLKFAQFVAAVLAQKTGLRRYDLANPAPQLWCNDGIDSCGSEDNR
jgi:UDP-N-acetyl-D-mannosaminuronic acid transferase (WecB/TagA/CpsF family)